MSTTYASLALTENDHQLYEEAIKDFSKGLGARYEIHAPSARTSPLFVRNPADTRETVAVFSQATPEEVDSAVAKGKKIWREIEALGWDKRFEIMQLAANLVRERRYRIAANLTYEAGKTRGEALAEADEVVAMIDNYQNLLKELNFYTTDFYRSRTNSNSSEESISLMRSLGGPVAVIVPFNFPFALAASMSMAAFLAGNPVIFKPSNSCPLSTLQWRGILYEAGVPLDACSLVIGSGETVGEQLISHPDIACVAFTGSLVVGQHIKDEQNKLEHKYIFRASPVLEMGGSNPVIIMPSADFKGAGEGTLRSILGFSGQKCSAARRIITVGEKTAENFVQAVTDIVQNGFPNGQKIIIGDPRHRNTFLGPLISVEASQDYLDCLTFLYRQAERKNAQMLKLYNDEIFVRKEHGHFALPYLAMLLGKLSQKAKYKECFSPIAVLEKANSLEEAIIAANDTCYGLTAGIFSQEEKELKYFFEHIEAGSTYANRVAGATTGCWPGVQTFGGWKGSGSTGRNAFGKWYPLNFLREQNQTRWKT